MELFRGKTLLKKDGTTMAAEAALRNKRIICIYFAAKWCPPCRNFTPALAEAYREAKQEGLPIEEYGDSGKRSSIWDKRILHQKQFQHSFTETRRRALDKANRICTTIRRNTQQIVFVSSDRNSSEMVEYVKASHGEWLSLPYGDVLQSVLKARYKVAGIPTLVVVKADGALICANGRPDVQAKASQAFKDWLSSI